MSYKGMDHQIDAEEACSGKHETKALCWLCIKQETEQSERLLRAKWLEAVRASWTCLGCGAEIGIGNRMIFSDGCHRCAALFGLIDEVSP